MMRYILLVIALMTTLSAFDWPSDYEEALAQAKEEKKEIYLLIGSEYCPWCEKFEKKVLAQEEVVNRLKKDYILLYLSKDIDDIPNHLETRPIPRHYFLSAEGEVIYTTVGYRSVEDFYEVIDDAKDIKK